MTADVTAIILTAIICATLVIITAINKGGKGGRHE